MFDIILLVILGFIEGFERADLGDDWPRENFGLIELSNVGLCNSLLLFVAVKNGRAILSAGVGTLPIELGGIVGHRKKDFEQLTK